MAMTKMKRKVLKEARKLISGGESTYICFALDEVASRYSRDDFCQTPEESACDDLCNFISHALGRSAYLDGWQVDNGFGVRSCVAIRLDRLAWIDYLLSFPDED